MKLMHSNSNSMQVDRLREENRELRKFFGDSGPAPPGPAPPGPAPSGPAPSATASSARHD